MYFYSTFFQDVLYCRATNCDFIIYPDKQKLLSALDNIKSFCWLIK